MPCCVSMQVNRFLSSLSTMISSTAMHNGDALHGNERRTCMLTSDLIKPRLQQTGRALSVEMLDEQSPFWQQTATELIALFHCHVGSSLTTWDQALEAYLGDRIDYP